MDKIVAVKEYGIPRYESVGDYDPIIDQCCLHWDCVTEHASYERVSDMRIHLCEVHAVSWVESEWWDAYERIKIRDEVWLRNNLHRLLGGILFE